MVVQVTELLDSAEVMIVPVVNPDGYAVRKMTLSLEYLWSPNLLTVFFGKFKKCCHSYHSSANFLVAKCGSNLCSNIFVV